MAKSMVTVTRLVMMVVLFCDKCQEESEAQDATHDWVVVLKQLTLGKAESDSELQPSYYRPDEIVALVLLGVGLFSDVDDHDLPLTLCDCLCFIMHKGIDHCPSCVSEATSLRLATESGVSRGPEWSPVVGFNLHSKSTGVC